MSTDADDFSHLMLSSASVRLLLKKILTPTRMPATTTSKELALNTITLSQQELLTKVEVCLTAFT